MGSVTVAAAVVLTLLLGACGKKSEIGPTQVAAKVGKEEISVHQVNFLLKRQPPVPAAQQDKVRQEALERLIDQELVLAKARELKLDREPDVIQAIEAAKREIVARAYVSRMTSQGSKPTPEAIKAYHDGHSQMFAQRKVYDVQEVNVQGTPDKLAPLAERLKAAKTADEANALVRSASLLSEVRGSTVGPENVPPALFTRLAALPAGQSMVLNVPGGAKVVFVTSSRAAPVDEATALPRIADFLDNSRKRELIEKDLKELRAASKVEYLGAFASGAGAAAPSQLPPTAAGPAASPSPSPATSEAPSAASGAVIDAATINRGLK
jgi:EpsD family peptidyl-prolyl cis-trans isomerase